MCFSGAEPQRGGGGGGGGRWLVILARLDYSLEILRTIKAFVLL